MMRKVRSLEIVIQALGVFPKEAKIKYLKACIVQILLSIMDLIGLAIIAGIGSISIHAISGSTPGFLVTQILSFLSIENFSPLPQIAILGIITVILFSGKTLLSVLMMRRIIYFLSTKGAQLSSTLTSKVLNRNLISNQKWSSQELMFNTTYGVNVISNSILGTSISVVSDLSLVVIIVLGILIADFKIALFSVLIFLPLFSTSYFLLKNIINRTGRRITKLNIASNELIAEVLGAYRELFVRNRLAHYLSQVTSTRHELSESLAIQALIPNAMKYIVDFSLILGTFTLAMSLFVLESTSHAVAGITIFLAASSRFAPALLRLQQNVLTIISGAAQAEATLALIEESKDWEELDLGKQLFQRDHAGFEPSIEVTNLSFSYPGEQNPLIQNFNQHIEPGEFVAVVGRSGIGKTTLVDLILGVHTPVSGSVKISGASPKEAACFWPGAISYVPQNVFCIPGTIKSNVCLGFEVDNVLDSDVWDSLEQAELKDTVLNFPDGLSHKVQENGTNLSGGQRQRLGIARALITNPKILVLDEATSALDSQTETAINHAIALMKKRRTIIVIAHRMSTIRSADKIIYFESPQSIKVGTFESLENILNETHFKSDSLDQI